MSEGEFKKRFKYSDYNYQSMNELIEKWHKTVDEARKEFQALEDERIENIDKMDHKTYGRILFQRLVKRHKWFLKWFGREEKNDILVSRV